MNWILIGAAIGIMISGASSAAKSKDCEVRLKPSDGFKELSAKLECLENRIRVLEGGGAQDVSVDQSVADTPIRNVALKGGKILGRLSKCAWSSQNGDLYCSFSIMNKTSDDQKMCLGRESRLVTDISRSFSKAGWFYAGIGSKQDRAGPGSGGDLVCDLIPPYTKVEAWIRFLHSKGGAKAKVQFVRLDCGADCKIDAFNVPIE